MKRIKVQGQGRVDAEPDIVIISFEMQQKDEEYADCMDNLNLRTNQLREDLESAGIKSLELKTTDFAINTDESYDKGTYYFHGYKASHDLIITLPMNKDHLNSIFKKVTSGGSEAKIQLSFSVADKEALQAKAVELAVQKAKEKAEIISKAAGVKLGTIQEINYGWNEIRIYEETDRICSSPPGPCASPDITPAEVHASDNVTIIYEIVE